MTQLLFCTLFFLNTVLASENTLSPSVPFNSDTTNATCATMLCHNILRFTTMRYSALHNTTFYFSIIENTTI